MNSLRFVQTGDWHLGQAYRGVDPDLAVRLRAGRLEAVGRVLAEAERRGAAFVIAAGDQFDGFQPSLDVVRDLVERIDGHPSVTVHLIPGNHDPCAPGSAYERAAFRSGPSNLHVHLQPGPIRLDELGATLFVCPCADRYGENPMAWLPPRTAPEGWRVAIAHGSLPGFAADADGRNYPIPADAPDRYDLDYVALGDWHTPNPDPTARPNERMYYAGAPEVGGWDETGAGFALDVELVRESPPRVAAFRVGHFRWREHRPELHTANDLARLAITLGEESGPDRVVRVVPKGALGVDDRLALEALIADRAGRFAGLELDPRDLRLASATIDDRPDDPLIRAVHDRLSRLAIDPADGPPRAWPKNLVAPDAEAARRALHRLRDLLS